MATFLGKWVSLGVVLWHVVSYVLARYKGKMGCMIGSQSLISEGQHSMVEVYTSLLVFVGVALSHYGYFVAEVSVGLAIGLYVIKVGLWLGKDAVLVLMDACLSPQRAKEMKEMAESVHGVKGVHDIRLRKSVPVSFGEMHIELQEDLPLDKAHMVSKEIETKIKKRFKDVDSIVKSEEDGYVSKVATTVKQACELIEAGFECVCEIDSTRIFRKRK